MSGAAAAIRVERLTYRHRGAALATLDDVSFEVGSGAVAAVVGESGAGKTTLLRCLAGLARGERGTITIGDRRIDAAAATPKALRGRVGLVFQSFELFPHMSALENCMLAPMRVRGASRAAAAATARELLTQLGLGGRIDAYPSELSGGQCQRVAIARALAMAPACLLYDEPTSALDGARKGEVVEVLRQVRTTGVTQLVVTHDAGLVTAAADAVFTLADGRLAAVR